MPHPPLLPAYAAQAPYNVVVVELADAPRIRLVGQPGRPRRTPRWTPSTRRRLRIGAPVQVVFTELPDGATVPRWLLERP